jgi:nicotinate-nucleotide--dimethylbenzimidazole phosphoribosyltransferase
MPHWALGRLLDLAVDLAGMTRTLEPPLERKVVFVMAGDHGVTEEGVSAYSSEVTVQMIHNFVQGGAGINVLAEQAGARVVVVDAGVAGDLSDLVESGQILSRRIAPGTDNIARGPAMSRPQAILSVETGIQTALDFSSETDLYATGEMGIGNTTPSSAIVSVLCGLSPDDASGCGTGIAETERQWKGQIIDRAIKTNRPDPADALDVLAKVGGFEIGAIAGLILGAAVRRKPVLVDGFISTAGALLAQGLCPASADYMIAAHRSVEPGHQAALAKLKKKPLLDMEMRLGEGTGAALAMHLVEAAVRVMTRMATFEQAGVDASAKIENAR